MSTFVSCYSNEADFLLEAEVRPIRYIQEDYDNTKKLLLNITNGKQAQETIDDTIIKLNDIELVKTYNKAKPIRASLNGLKENKIIVSYLVYKIELEIQERPSIPKYH